MKKWKTITLISLIIFLGSFAILFVPNFKSSTTSLIMSVEPNIELEGTYETNSIGRNYGAIPRRKVDANDTYLDMAKTINATSLPTSFNLADELNIEVKNQEQYGLCYAFAALSSLETTIAKNYGEYYNFSEIYLPYAEALNIGETTISLAGGNFKNLIQVANAYGLALDSEMPYPTFTYPAGSYIPTITNAYGTGSRLDASSDGSSYYYQYTDLTTAQIQAIKNTAQTIDLQNAGIDFPSETADTSLRRNAIKNHIFNYGGLYAQFYYSDEFLTNGIYKYTGSQNINHAITLVGWDDSKSAYIALNSWSEDWNGNGYFYISYNDVHIENGVSGFLPEGIKFGKNQQTGSLVCDGDLYGYTSLSGLNTAVSVLKNSTGVSTIYIDKIHIPLYSMSDSVSVSYGITSNSIDGSGINSVEFTTLNSSFKPSNSYLTGVSGIYTEGLYCFELETPIALDSSQALAVKVTYSGSIPAYAYKTGTYTNGHTYFYNNVTYIEAGGSSGSVNYEYILDVQASYTNSSLSYNLEVGLLNDAISSNYVDYFASVGGALYIPIGVEDSDSSISEFEVEIQKLKSLSKETISSGYAVKHSSLNPNFDSDNNGINDKQNIYIEFDSKPEEGSYVATVSYGEDTINKYFEVVETVEEKQIYEISYNLDGAIGVTNDNPTLFYAGWQNVILNNPTSAISEFEYWQDLNNLETNTISTTSGDVEVIAIWEETDAVLEVTLNEIDDFTYDGSSRTISINLINSYTNYDEKIVAWYKDGSTEIYSTAEELNIKNVEDSGTYKCVVTLKLSTGETIATTEAETNVIVSAQTLIVSPVGNIVQKLTESARSIEYDYSGNISGEIPAFVGSLLRDQGNTAGSYAINKGNLTLANNGSFIANNYILEFSNTNEYKYYLVSLTLTVTAAQSKTTYDGTNLTFGITSLSNSYPTNYFMSEVFIWYKVSSNGAEKQVGRFETKETATLTYKNVEDSGTYKCFYGIYGKNGVLIDSTTATTSISIGTRNLTVSASSSHIKNYGEADPNFAYIYNGQVLGETPAFSGALSRVSGENVGNYLINVGNLALADSETFKASNYSFTFDNNSNHILTIEKATLLLMVSSSEGDGNQTKIYGDPDPEITLKVVSGLRDGERVRFNKSVSRVNTEEVGTYNYILDGVELVSESGYASSDNYNLELQSATLTITHRELTLALYYVDGGTNILYTTPFIYTNVEKQVTVVAGNVVKNNEGVLDDITLYYTEDSTLTGVDAGTYTVIVESVNNSNYKLPDNVSFTWVISKATPVAPQPQLFATYGDKLLSIVLDSGLAWEESYDENTVVGDVGTHTFNAVYTPSDTTNYEILNVSLTITVNAKKLTITPISGQNKIYDGVGGINSTLTFSISEEDLISGEKAATRGALTREDIESKSVGIYKILLGSLELVDNGNFKKSNYEINFVNNVVYEIKFREILLNFENYENLYFDGTDKEIIVTFENKVAGDDISIMFKNEKLEANNSITNLNGNIYAINKGRYDIEIDYVTGNDASNYTYKTELDFEFEIKTATIVVTPVQNQGKVYGEEDLVIKYTYTGTIGQQEPKFEGTLSRISGENVTNYQIILGSLKLIDNGEFIASNYELKLADTPVYFVIAARPITLVAVEDAPTISKTFDGNNSYSNTSNILFGTHFSAKDGCILERDLANISISVNSASFDSIFATVYNDTEYVLGAKTLTIGGFSLSGGLHNYIVETESLIINGKINKATLSVSAICENREYDGTNKIDVSLKNLTGIIGKYEVALKESRLVGTLSSSNIGTYSYLNGQIYIEKPELVDVYNNGYENNYNLSISDFSVTITAKEINAEEIVWIKGSRGTFKLVVNSPFVYNGENQMESLHAFFLDVDKVTKIWLSLNVWNGETFKNAREYIIETECTNANYVLAANATSKKICIEQKELQLILDKTDYQKVYDGLSEKEITFVGLDGIINHEDVNLSIAPTKLIANSANVGVYCFENNDLAFDISLTLTGSDSNNYKIAPFAITLEIEQKIADVNEITWSLGGNVVAIQNGLIELDYDGLNQLDNLAVKFIFNEVAYDLALEIVSGGETLRNVGTYQVQAVSASGENVGISSENPVVITIEILKKDLYINLVTENKVYDKTNYVSISSQSIVGIASGDEILLNLDELVLTTEDKNVGENLSVLINGDANQVNGIMSSIVLGGETTLDNYNIYVIAPAIKISQKEVHPSWQSGDLVYNGTAQIPVCLLDGVLFGDECKGVFDGYTRNVTNSPVTANIRSLTNSNYKLSSNNTSILFTISPARIKIKTTDLSVPEGSEINYSYEVVEGTLYEGDKLNITYELQEKSGEAHKFKIIAKAFNPNYEIEYEFGILTEITVNRTFVMIVFGFIVVFFVVEIIVLRVKAIKKAKSRPTLKKAEGVNDGKND